MHAATESDPSYNTFALRARLIVLRTLYVIADFLERHPSAGIILLLVATLPYLAIKAHANHLSCDEIYTLRIAQQPTLTRLLFVSRQIDLHPPLHFLLERAALTTHLPELLAARLPSMLATAGSLIFLYLFVAGRLGPLFGLFAVAMLWFSPALDFGWSNRPYALWICFLCASLWCWQKATQSRNLLWPLALLLAVTAMVLNYMAGLVCILPLMAAELYRPRGTRLSWPIWTALILPSLGALLYAEQISTFAQNGFALTNLRWFDTAQSIYVDIFTLPATVLIVCTIATILLISNSATNQGAPSSPPASSSVRGGIGEAEPSTAAHISKGFRPEDLVLTTGLLLLPAIFATLAALRHTQFFFRYGICASVGMALLLTWALKCYTAAPKLIASLTAIALLIAAIVQCNDALFVYAAPWRATLATGVPPIQLAALDATLPIVIASPTQFTEMAHYEPDAIRPRLVYVSDRAAALRYSGSTVFENEAYTLQLLGIPATATPYPAFTAAHRQFYLIANYTQNEEWLPRKLIDSGAHLRYLGKFPSNYADDDIYLVTQ